MASPNDTKMHEKTYSGFVSLLKWAVPLTAALVLVILLLIA